MKYKWKLALLLSSICSVVVIAGICYGFPLYEPDQEFTLNGAVELKIPSSAPKLPEITQHTQAPKELQDMVQAQFGGVAPEPLSDEQKINFLKEGFTLEDISAAEQLAQVKHVKQVEDLLRHNLSEIEAHKEKLDKMKQLATPGDLIDPEKEQQLMKKGYSKQSISLAYSLSTKMDMTVEDVLYKLQSGDMEFGSKMREQGRGTGDEK